MNLTYKLEINYDPDAKISTQSLTFFNNLASNKPEALLVLKLFIYLILKRENKYQLALYLWGAAGSGKSVFENLLLSLVGLHNSSSFSLNELNNLHSLYALKDSILSVFPDVSKFRGDPSRLKAIISGDLIGARQLYKDKISFNPKTLVLITSNMLWEPNDPTNGLQRRFIYLNVDKYSGPVDRDLLNVKNNQYSGKLYDNLPGIINWALTTTPEELNFFNQDTIDINHILCPGLNAEVNPLILWLQENLEIKEGIFTPIGNKKYDPNKYLYPNYFKFCMDQGVNPLSIQEFSNALLQQLSLFYKDMNFSKKRTNKDTQISNIQLISS